MKPMTCSLFGVIRFEFGQDSVPVPTAAALKQWCVTTSLTVRSLSLRVFIDHNTALSWGLRERMRAKQMPSGGSINGDYSSYKKI